MHLKVLDMALSRLGDYITVIDIRNSDQNIKTVFGLNNKKEFMPTVATIDENSDISKYKLVEKGMFVFSGMQTGRDQNIRIGYSDYDFTFVISPAYTTFKVTNIIPTYFFMIFKSTEMDRYGAFLSDSSVRSNLDWDVFCNIELDIPPIEVQQKVVDVYLAMVANQKAYEKGLEDLKITYEAYIENLRRTSKKQSINSYLFESLERNIGSKVPILGVSIEKRFIEAKRESTSYENYKIVKHNEFAFRPVLDKMDSSFTLALNSSTNCAVSPAYIVFGTKNEILLPKYLMLWLSRKETERWLAFNAWGSARNTIELSDLGNLEIPIPTLNIQQDIVEVFEAYEIRKKINETLKKQINEICPILIKGSV